MTVFTCMPSFSLNNEPKSSILKYLNISLFPPIPLPLFHFLALLLTFSNTLQDEDLDISPVEIDEALVIEDDDISDDEDDDHEDVCYILFFFC